jgi:16S rRNA (cytosine967-C5)-methyltransferase
MNARRHYHHLKPDSLAYALLGAAHAVALVRKGTALPQALGQVFAKLDPPSSARGAMQDIAYRTTRRWGQSDALVAALTKKSPEPPLLHALLACALALIADPDDAVYETFTVVNQAVGAVAADRDTGHAKGMANAVLRRFLRERDALLRQIAGNPEAVWNYPRWWIDAAKAAYPQTWQSILRAGNTAPPLTLRINRRVISVADYLGTLAENAMSGTQIGPAAVRLAQPVPVHRIPGFDQGWVSVQDAAAQLAAPLLDVRDGMRVLDACAAPGGKTGHLLETADIDLTALDRDPQRLQRIEQNLQRLKLHATIKNGDAAGDNWWDGTLFDRILADVPCTASGIVRRHPDIRWLRRESDAAQLATLSRQILDNLWRMLRPDGKLLFVTCSLWPEESEAQAAAFALRQHAVRLPVPGQLLPEAEAHSDHDGLFYALFLKPTS